MNYIQPHLSIDRKKGLFTNNLVPDDTGLKTETDEWKLGRGLRWKSAFDTSNIFFPNGSGAEL